MTDIAAVVAVAGIVLVAGIRLGMLVAPRLARWTDRADRADEDPYDD
ncbi:MAG TPA: hypothetical protein VHS36_07420 [Candidatus Limnocylindrales bacterium]|nr:hypothetical protein [Candidatus Limnocylindrales bacterium]